MPMLPVATAAALSLVLPTAPIAPAPVVVQRAVVDARPAASLQTSALLAEKKALFPPETADAVSNLSLIHI